MNRFLRPRMSLVAVWSLLLLLSYLLGSGIPASLAAVPQCKACECRYLAFWNKDGDNFASGMVDANGTRVYQAFGMPAVTCDVAPAVPLGDMVNRFTYAIWAPLCDNSNLRQTSKEASAVPPGQGPIGQPAVHEKCTNN